ncbi:UvrD-helicase domain-containing protein, partial [Luminiphilus sp.]|nr:UvrD-helicase domain-containing protein [Luminiphilus sp.]
SLLLQTLIEIRHLPIVARGSEAWDLIVLISALLPVLQAHLLLVFQRTGAVDHTHIALAAIQALGSDEMPTALAQRLDYQVEHILVDEFQDTSSSQAELLKRLMRGWPEHNATGAAPRTLFIVGDAMQSIYGFRYADVALFLSARQGYFGGIPLEPVTLSRNFRSGPEIVDWVNEVFADLMGAEDRPHHGTVRHVKAVSPPGKSSAVGAGVKVRLFEDGEGQSEAQFIATQVANVMERDPHATIAILVRAKSHAEPVTAALEQAGIPFSGDAIQSLADQPVISDLLALCRYLANSADTIAAISLLRGPWCGVTLNTLVQLLNAHPERPLDLLHALQHRPSVADDEERRLQRVLAVLQWAEMKRDRLALSIWVEQIWLRLGGSLAARGHDLWRVEAFLSLLRRAETSGSGLSMEWLDREIISATVDSPDTDSRVTIMTLHKAKGLEFDYVFIPHLQKRARSQQRELIRWHWHGHAESRRLLIAANDDDKEPQTLYNYLSWLQKQKDQEELKRLLYVGVTRAKVATFLTASIETPDDEDTADGVSGSLWRLLLTSKTAKSQIMRLPANSQAYLPAEGSYEVAERSRRYRLSLEAKNQPATDDTPATLIDNVQSSVAMGAGNRWERIIGLVTHRVLELTASEALPESARDPRVQTWIHHNLSQYALTPKLFDRAVARVGELIELTLACETGRWILAARVDAKNELAISRVEAGEVKNYVIDRTFLDDREEVRWVIDYKTSEPLDGESSADFTARESEAYREQLQNYAELVSGLRWEHDVPIKTALYFPAIQQLSVYE